jgi:hypothetical protein
MFKLFVFWILVAGCSLFLMTGIPVGAVLALPVDYGFYPHLDRIDDVSGEVFSVEAYSLFGTDYFAVVNETEGVGIYKIVGGEVVHIINHHVLGSERDIAVNGWIAYVATGSVGISSLQVAIPESPVEQDNLDLPGSPVRLAVSSTHAFVACGAGGLAVVDITNPAFLNLVGSYGTDVRTVSLDGNRLGIVNEGDFEILDITNPADPVFLGSHPAPSSSGFFDAVLRGDVAYTGFLDRIERLDISDPAAIALTQEMYLNYPYLLYDGRLNIAQDELLVSANSYLAFIDFATGGLNRESKGFGPLTDAAVLGGKIAVSEENRVGFYHDGMHEPAEPAAFHDFTDLMYPKGIMLNDLVYGVSLSPANGLGAFALSGAAPGMLWSMDLELTGGSIDAMAQEGSLLAALTFNGKMAFASVFRTGAILRGSLELKQFDTPASSRVLAFLDEQTVIALDNSEDGEPRNFRVIDVSDPDHPLQIGRYFLAGSFGTQLLTTGSLVLISSGPTVEIYDGQDRQNFQYLTTHDFGYRGIRIYVKGDHLYSVQRGTDQSLDGKEHIQTWDISDPINRLQTSELNLANTRNFTLAGDFAYQAGSGLILDLSQPANPVPVGNFSLLNTSENQMHEVLASEKYLLTGWLSSNSYRVGHSLPAQKAGAISSVEDDLPPGGLGLVLQAIPNPFNPRTELRFELAMASLTRLEIFDLRGRLVADLGEEHREKGLHRVKWDGLDRDGRNLPSGVYLARVVTPMGSVAKKIVLAR